MLAKYIKDGVKYYKVDSVTIDGRTFNNPSERLILQAGYEIYTPTDEEYLEDAKSSKLLSLLNYYQSFEMNQCFFDGDRMWFSETAQSNILTQIMCAGFYDQDTVTLTYEDISKTVSLDIAKRFILELGEFCKSRDAAYKTHQEAINALITVDEVNAYDVKAGWPAQLNYTIDEIQTLEEEEPKGSDMILTNTISDPGTTEEIPDGYGVYIGNGTQLKRVDINVFVEMIRALL